MTYKYVLFDLDGTLIDSQMGITKSISFALDQMGIEEVDLNSLTRFIGPPLQDSFSGFYGFNPSEVSQAIEFYRERYRTKGVFENEIYEGIPELLKLLVSEGKVLAVATSKPTMFAEQILEHLGLNNYFQHIVGSNMDGSRSKKAEVIEYTLQQLGVEEKSEVVMIGDREHDIKGAKAIGIDVIGIEYGYGSRHELEEAGATLVLETVEDLKKRMLSGLV